MKILVTGGAGFIGSNVVDAYIEKGYEVVVVDNLISGDAGNVNPKARFHLMDIRSPELRRVFEIERPDVVNHHAAQISVPASVEDPSFDADVNIRGLLNILEAGRMYGTRKIIFISSGGAIYGEAEEYPTTEAYPPKPLSPYGISKLVSERYLEFYRHQYGLEYTVLRYSNIYGPRQIPHGEAGVVAIFMDRLLDNKPCTLYHFPDEPDGMTRDYCFVGDVVKANILALEKGDGGVFNIGTGTGTKTRELFGIIFDTVRKSKPDLSPGLGEPERGGARKGDLRRSCLNIERAKDILGWEPSVGLREGIEKTLEWRLR